MLINDLRVNEEERSWLALHTGLHETELEVVAPVTHRVPFNDFNLIQLVVAHESSQSAKRLATGATDTEKKGISLWLPKDSANSADVIASIQEHDEFHGTLATGVLVVKELHNPSKHGCEVLYLDVRPVLAVDTGHVVSINETIDIEDVLSLEFELLHFGNHELNQSSFILVVDHTITEDPLVLVHPQTYYRNGRGCRFCVGRAATLHDLRDVTHVECVVRFAWSWLQSVSDVVE